MSRDIVNYTKRWFRYGRTSKRQQYIRINKRENNRVNDAAIINDHTATGARTPTCAESFSLRRLNRVRKENNLTKLDVVAKMADHQ